MKNNEKIVNIKDFDISPKNVNFEVNISNLD
jgi:hypothetical protein